jgi:hypothetical protein
LASLAAKSNAVLREIGQMPRPFLASIEAPGGADKLLPDQTAGNGGEADMTSLHRHSRAGGNPEWVALDYDFMKLCVQPNRQNWFPAFAGMTKEMAGK